MSQQFLSFFGPPGGATRPLSRSLSAARSSLSVCDEGTIDGQHRWTTPGTCDIKTRHSHDTHSCCRARHDLRQTCAAHAVALHRSARRSTWRLPSTRYASPARLRRMACRWHSERLDTQLLTGARRLEHSSANVSQTCVYLISRPFDILAEQVWSGTLATPWRVFLTQVSQ